MSWLDYDHPVLDTSKAYRTKFLLIYDYRFGFFCSTRINKQTFVHEPHQALY